MASLWVALFQLLQVGLKPNQKMEGWRFFVLFWSLMLGLKIFFVFNLISLENNQRTDVCYKQYLGPEWAATFEGAGTLVSNHSSWIDIPVLSYWSFPSFVSKKETLNIPIIGRCSQII